MEHHGYNCNATPGPCICAKNKKAPPPNTQGDSWEREFDDRFLLDSARDPKSHRMLGNTGFSIGNTPARQIKDFVRTILSKERAEGERHVAEVALALFKEREDEGREEVGMNDVLNYLHRVVDGTLPTDNTEIV